MHTQHTQYTKIKQQTNTLCVTIKKLNCVTRNFDSKPANFRISWRPLENCVTQCNRSLCLCIFEIRMFFEEKWEKMRLGFRAKLLDQPDGNFDPSPDHWSASKTTDGNWFSTRWHGWENQDFWKWVLVNIFPTTISSCEYFEVGSQVFQSLWEPEKANLWEI